MTTITYKNLSPKDARLDTSKISDMKSLREQQDRREAYEFSDRLIQDINYDSAAAFEFDNNETFDIDPTPGKVVIDNFNGHGSTVATMQGDRLLKWESERTSAGSLVGTCSLVNTDQGMVYGYETETSVITVKPNPDGTLTYIEENRSE